MPTSDIRPGRDAARRAGAVAGFTLLELVVVLALLGLATALVAPAGFRTIDTWRRASEVDTALGSLAALGAHAHQQGRATRLDAGVVPAGTLADLPEGWTVTLNAPLQVQANGACTATRGELRAADGYTQPFELQAPFCRTLRSQPEGE